MVLAICGEPGALRRAPCLGGISGSEGREPEGLLPEEREGNSSPSGISLYPGARSYDPTGLKDKRTTDDKAVLEDPDVLQVAAQILEMTKLGEPLKNRQEAGAVVVTDGPGEFSVEGGAQTQGNLTSVKLTLGVGPGGEVTSRSGKALAATIHSHPGTGRVRSAMGARVILGGQASDADKRQAGITAKPLYILNADTSMLRVTTIGGHASVEKILTGRDYREYLARARSAK